jgi:hypothetical protein
MVPGIMDRPQAEKIRDALMAERSVFVQEVVGEYFGRVSFIAFNILFSY